MTAPGPGRFITLEGGEGAGKSTQARLLSDKLARHGIENLVTREPGGSPGAEDIRKLLVEGEPGRWNPLVETLLMFAARADHVERTVRPALHAAKWVICDRFTDSTFAYQGAGRGGDAQMIEAVAQVAIGAFKPDLTIILDVPVEEAMQRIGSRQHDETRFEKFERAFHERIRAHFRQLAQEEPERCVLIESSAPADEVSQQIWRATATRFGL